MMRTGTFRQGASYQDRYGRHGKIAVLAGRITSDGIFVDTWGMSCRAFARQIEYHCLAQLFERFGADQIAIDFIPTARNQPVHEFFRVFLGELPRKAFKINRAVFLEKCPRLFHRVSVSESACSTVAG